MVKVGTRWAANDHKIFHVIDLIEIEGKIWVHYICENADFETDNKEFSCYQESFLARFRQLPE
jgi:hypothetical protein